MKPITTMGGVILGLSLTVVGCAPRDFVLGVEPGAGDGGVVVGDGAWPLFCEGQRDASVTCEGALVQSYLRPSPGGDRILGGALDPNGRLMFTGEVASLTQAGQRSEAFVGRLDEQAQLATLVLSTWRNRNWHDRAVAILPGTSSPSGVLTLVGERAVNGHQHYMWIDAIDLAAGMPLQQTTIFSPPGCAESECVLGISQQVNVARQLPNGDVLLGGTFKGTPAVPPAIIEGQYHPREAAGLILRAEVGGSPTWARVMRDLDVEAVLDLHVRDDGSALAVARSEQRGNAQFPGGQDLLLLAVSVTTGEASEWRRVTGTRSIGWARSALAPDGSLFVLLAFTGVLDLKTEVLVADDQPGLAVAKIQPSGAVAWSRFLGTTRSPEAFALSLGDGQLLVGADLQLVPGSPLARRLGAGAATLLLGFDSGSGGAAYTMVLNTFDAAEINTLLPVGPRELWVLGAYSGRFGPPTGVLGTATAGDTLEHSLDIFALRVRTP